MLRHCSQSTCTIADRSHFVLSLCRSLTGPTWRPAASWTNTLSGPDHHIHLDCTSATANHVYHAAAKSAGSQALVLVPEYSLLEKGFVHASGILSETWYAVVRASSTFNSPANSEKYRTTTPTVTLGFANCEHTYHLDIRIDTKST